MVVAIRRAGKMIISPMADDKIYETDSLIILARYEDIEKLTSHA